MGTSGCGKTTLISCLVGLRVLDKGEMKIFNQNSKCVHKSRIGFMPQGTSLNERLKIKETIWFFGTIFGLDEIQIKSKFEFLSLLLDLPDGDKLIKNCSGGEQRRISLAVTLVHGPELLILDEPTVGLDPVLRGSIWSYLFDIARNENKTILLSTHYIEEAMNSHRVGLMRNGFLIDADSPKNLMMKCGMKTLDEAFLEISAEQKTSNKCSEYTQESVDDETLKMKAPARRRQLMITCTLLRKLFWEFLRNWE
jgi:ABC-type multidrug transport system ATPase subunit